MTSRRAALATAVLSGVFLAGCGGGDPGASSDPAAPTASSGQSGTDSPAPAPSPSVEPATGPVLESPLFTVHAPAGWKQSVKFVFGNIARPRGQDERSTIVIGIANNYSTPTDFGRMIRIHLKSSLLKKQPERLADTTLGGEPAFHLAGPTGESGGFRKPDLVLDSFGALHGTTTVTVDFKLQGSAAERRALIDSVLATWQWK